MGKKVLLIGSGGREHALAWKLKQSPLIEQLFAAPGNPGMAAVAECVDIAADDLKGLLAFAGERKIDLTVVGPELPLSLGITDLFNAHGLAVFGPTQAAARLEGSKLFAKELFSKYGIPTAAYAGFTDAAAAIEYARRFTDRGQTVVIKADGLAAGKGVVLTAETAVMRDTINSMMQDGSLGEAGRRVIIEEFLEGEELSYFAICDGQNYIPLMTAQDHKRVFDGDQGPNTGGMGAYSNPPVFNAELGDRIVREIIEPTIAGMTAEGCPYTGVLYAGLMLTADGPKVLEYNARFGDPETQVMMPMIANDLYPVLQAAADGRLEGQYIEVKAGNCVGVVLASEGYPGAYEKGRPISGLEQLAPDTLVFHAGTARSGDGLVTNGGRVMLIACCAENIAAAQAAVYKEVARISFAGMHYRTDIAHRALK